MAEADSALRAEIEKVRERARLQVLAQGLDPEAAEIQADAAVEDFCTRWGIRPEMLGPGLLRGARPAAAPAKVGPKSVDLGASPLRTTVNPSQTQALRIGDLLKKAREMEAAASGRPASPAPASEIPGSGPAFAQAPLSSHGAGAGVPRNTANLTSLLQRMKSQGLPPAGGPAAQAPVPAAGPMRPAAAPVSPFRGPSAPAPSPAVPLPPMPRSTAAIAPRGVTSSDPLGGTGSLTANAERRRQVIEEFDRTYAEVQAMLEQRIGVVDVALNDASQGLTGAMARAQAGGLDAHELEVLAGDVDRLHQHLQVMMSLCEEFLSHLQGFSVRAGGPGDQGSRVGGSGSRS